MTTKTMTIAIIVIILGLAGNRLPWVPKAFHARFPVSVKSYLHLAWEKKPLVPMHGSNRFTPSQFSVSQRLRFQS